MPGGIIIFGLGIFVGLVIGMFIVALRFERNAKNNVYPLHARRKHKLDNPISLGALGRELDLYEQASHSEITLSTATIRELVERIEANVQDARQARSALLDHNFQAVDRHLGNMIQVQRD